MDNMPHINRDTIETVIILIGLIVPVAEVIVRLTPSDKDNSIVNKIKTFYDTWFPNRKSNGSKFN